MFTINLDKKQTELVKFALGYLSANIDDVDGLVDLECDEIDELMCSFS